MIAMPVALHAHVTPTPDIPEPVPTDPPAQPGHVPGREIDPGPQPEIPDPRPPIDVPESPPPPEVPDPGPM